ncbi:MAG TPA: hypothetical protein VFL95_10960, partial [Gemmatimonadales bacterium]|nr:hypothetical protein [Gemmatimonadales bacterium]
AWSYMEPRLRDLAAERRINLEYVGRPFRASPAEGYATAHAAEQARIVSAALESAPQHQRLAGAGADSSTPLES